ncbi:MAG: tetratricopeptide repeat protein [Cyclobacteriaceae bacterium]|nr:tetratricopeptide repeat protein [Cyclobacteriaceae bacterium]
MKKLLAGLIMIQVYTVAWAQPSDSLQTLIQNSKTDTTKAILLSILADELTKTNPQKSIEVALAGLTLSTRIQFERGIFENSFSLASAFQGQALFDSAILYFHVAEAAARRQQDVSAQAKVYSGLGHSFMRKSDMDSARYYLDRGLVLAQSVHDYRTEAGIYNNYGNVFLEESNFQQALDYFIKAAKLYENPVQDTYGQCLALSNIGNIEYRLGNYNKALNYALQSMKLAQQESLIPQMGYAHKLLGRIYRQQKKYDSALLEYDLAQKLYVRLGDIRSAAELLQNVGNIYFDKEQYAAALKNYTESLNLARKISNKAIIAYAYSAMGQANYVLKKNDLALLYLDSARIAAQGLNNAYLLMDTYEAISATYEAKGDYKKALRVTQQFVALKDSLTQAENRALMEETQARYELEKKQAQIDLLQKDKELITLDARRQRAIQIGAFTALALMLVIGILLINRYRTIARTRRLAEIEAVRNDIARDLHDDIGSTLSTINIISKLAMHENPTGNNTQLSRIAEQSSKTMESMSDIVWSINPTNDLLEKVLVKMKVFAAEILEPLNIAYRFSEVGVDTQLTLHAKQRKNFFLIFKEAINNVAKYSCANEVTISFKQQPKTITMTIADNGIGFDHNQASDGNGLRNMEARARDLQAKFSLKSEKGLGTTITVELPIT